MNLKKSLLIALPALLILIVWYSQKANLLRALEVPRKMNGVSYVAPPRRPPVDPMHPIDKLGADWVAIMPYAFARAGEPEIYFDRERQWWGEKTEGTIETICQAQMAGLNVMLKPHVWVRGQGWVGDYTLQSEEDWLHWEKSYARYLLHYAYLADSLNVPLFCLGLEWRHAVKTRPQFWFSLIDSVRKVYKGQLTYGANWDNYENVSFWDQLDFIGVHAYFPLSQEDTPSVQLLREAWEKPKSQLRDFAKKYKKPILFTEYGYRSLNRAAGKQWELEDNWRYEGGSNLEVQKHAYEALFAEFWDEPWFAGGFLWKWYHNHAEAGGSENSDYTPQNKPAASVISRYYSSKH